MQISAENLALAFRAFQGHSRLLELTQIERIPDFLLVIHSIIMGLSANGFQDERRFRSKNATFSCLRVFNAHADGGSLGIL